MRLGVIHLWGDDLSAFRREIRLSEELGYDLVGIGDSPAGWHDMVVSLTVAAMETNKVTIAPMVTSPFLRHPLIAAGAMSSLQELSGGRMKLGLATGGSTIIAIGRYPATQKEIREYWSALADLFEGKPITWEGRPVFPLRNARKVPIYYSAFGPKALKLAGERADGVILFTGSNLEGLDRKLDILRAAAKDAGRRPQDIDVWVCAFCSVRETRKQAIDDLKAFIVVNGMAIRTPEAMAQVPTQFKSKIEELHRRYDPTEHVVPGGKNVQLMDELGLTEFLSDFDTVAGSPTEVKAVLDGLEARGVSTFVCSMAGVADRPGTLRRIAEAAGKT